MVLFPNATPELVQEVSKKIAAVQKLLLMNEMFQKCVNNIPSSKKNIFISCNLFQCHSYTELKMEYTCQQKTYFQK